MFSFNFNGTRIQISNEGLVVCAVIGGQATAWGTVSAGRYSFPDLVPGLVEAINRKASALAQ